MNRDNPLGQYVLDFKGNPVACPDTQRWARWLERNLPARRVARTAVNGIEISTVFLGIDHNYWDDGPPILWETRVFNGRDDELMYRYVSRELAQRGHNELVKRTRARTLKQHRHPADARAFGAWCHARNLRQEQAARAREALFRVGKGLPGRRFRPKSIDS